MSEAAAYSQQGFLGPRPGCSAAEIERLGLLATIEPIALWPECRNRHLDVPAVAAICRLPTVAGVLQEILGPDLILWRSNIFAVSGGGRRLPWHRDRYAPLLDGPDDEGHCSLQINLSGSSWNNCVGLAPGSH